MEHVRPRRVRLQVPERRASREFVGPEECGVGHARRLADTLPHQVVERHATRALGDQGEHHEAAVAVGEPLARRERRVVAAERRQVVLRGDESVHGHRHEVVVDLEVGVLVKVVADARPIRQQVLDRHAIVDQGKVVAQDRTRGRRERERPVLDQAHHGERRQALRAARDRELRFDGVGDPVAAIGEPVGLRELDVARAIDTHDTRERCLLGQGVHGACQRFHAADCTRAPASSPDRGVAAGGWASIEFGFGLSAG
jgi:hypothetical protein